MRICSIASGSSGNCIYLGTDATHILIDAGCSKKKIVEGLHGLDIALEDLDAILVTHEHSDHVAGLKTLLKACGVPVYATAGTLSVVLSDTSPGSCGATLPSRGGQDVPSWQDTVFAITADLPFTIGDLRVTPFAISHDAAEPVCYRVESGDSVFAMATDLGVFDETTVAHLQNADVLLLEANHDVRMLQTGPYPYPLKQRILGDKGHLSNDATGALLNRILHDDLKAVMLGHLSERNNLKELAYETVRLDIEMGQTPYHASDFRLMVADRHAPSPVLVA